MPRYQYLDPRALARIGKVSLVARGVVEGFITGLHKSPYHGHSVEFAEHREYSAGDPLKHVDWRAFGRTDRLYVKLFEDETNVKCYLLLDRSASMDYRTGSLSKLEYGCYLSACLAYLMIRQQDSVGLVTFSGGSARFIAPRSSPSHLRVLLEELETLRGAGRSHMAKTFHDLADSIRRRSLIVIISDLLDEESEILPALHHFRHRKHDIILFHVLDHAEIEFPFRSPADFVDMETGERLEIDPRYVRREYLRELESFRSAFRKETAEGRIEYIAVDTSVSFERMLSAYLAKRR
ncbi:unnamed protein product, partial [marine sediment metagenome]